MSWPAFLERKRLLRMARRHFEEGEIAPALAVLADPRLALSDPARMLRQAVLEAVVRSAARALSQQDHEGFERWKRLLSAEDPARAAALEPAVDPASAEGSALVRLLAEMRGKSAPVPARGPAPGPVPGLAGVAETPATLDAQASRGVPARRFHLAVDDGGEFLVACGTSLVIGHLRSARADLPFLADVEAEHARVFRDESFHAGTSWKIAPVGTARVAIGGRAIEGGSAVLADGDQVELASNLAFRFRTPEAASASALLDLSGGAECEGARRILLFAPGGSGRVRIGPRRNRHVVVADLDEEVTLELEADLLVVRCAGGVGPLERGRPTGEVQALAVACPPARLLHLSAAARAADRPPFGLSLRPSEPAPRAGRTS